jgi:hypothetical protein
VGSISFHPMCYLDDAFDHIHDPEKGNACMLCGFPFPFNDIILSSCHHPYHP